MSTPSSRGEPARVRSRGHRFAVFRSGDLAELHRHGERSRTRLWLIGRQSLFLGFTFGANCGLECEARAMLSRDVFDRTVLGRTVPDGEGTAPCSVKINCPTLIFSPSFTSLHSQCR